LFLSNPRTFQNLSFCRCDFVSARDHEHSLLHRGLSLAETNVATRVARVAFCGDYLTASERSTERRTDRRRKNRAHLLVIHMVLV
jgi:hypothetical protein